jgi:hypothetical protein
MRVGEEEYLRALGKVAATADGRMVLKKLLAPIFKRYDVFRDENLYESGYALLYDSGLKKAAFDIKDDLDHIDKNIFFDLTRPGNGGPLTVVDG